MYIAHAIINNSKVEPQRSVKSVQKIIANGHHIPRLLVAFWRGLMYNINSACSK